MGKQLKNSGHGMFLAMPAPMRVWSAVPNDLPCPVTVREGRTWLDELAVERELAPVPEHPVKDFSGQKPAVSIEETWFRYEKDGQDIIKGLNLQAYYGQLFCF